MSILRCELCGGTIVLEENGTVSVCEYCGTRKTIVQPENTVSSGASNDNIQPEKDIFSQSDAFRIENERRKAEEANARAQEARLKAENQRLERERLSEKNRVERRKRSKSLRKKLLKGFLVLSAIFALGFFTITVVIPTVRYNNAEKALESKNYEEAYLTFKSLYKFKDSQTRATTILKDHPSVAQVGDIICFGKYEQDNNKSNGMEEIEWKVLEKDENGKMLLISKYALDCRNYHSSPKQVTWEESEIRGWLNTDFYATAFSSSEKSGIKTTTLENAGNSDFKVNGGNKTTDKVFLLSIDEAKSYFPKNLDRICIATKSAEIKGSELDGITRACRWWLRSPGSTLYSAASVKLDGFILDLGTPVSIDKAFIRPAIWVELK